jgi:hypothetical protein
LIPWIPACLVVVDEDEKPTPVPVAEAVPLPEAYIDRGEALDVIPGGGVGVHAFQEDGFWRFELTCDTSAPCEWDLVLTTRDASVFSVGGHVGNGDEISSGFDWVQFVGVTTSEVDAVELETAYEAAVVVDVYLDGGPAQEFVFWVENGLIRRGAPSNPFVLLPLPLE